MSACPCDVYERASRAGELSQATDAYSMGVLLLELITGLPAADGARAPGHRLLAQALAPRLGDVAALQVGGPGALSTCAVLCRLLACQRAGLPGPTSVPWAGNACRADVPGVLHARCHREATWSAFMRAGCGTCRPDSECQSENNIVRCYCCGGYCVVVCAGTVALFDLVMQRHAAQCLGA